MVKQYIFFQKLISLASNIKILFKKAGCNILENELTKRRLR